MFTLAGYEDFILIHHIENSRVYRARRTSDRLAVILKFLDTDYPTSEQIRRYKQEYHLTGQIDSPRIVKAYGLEPWQRSYVIVLEDFGGISLKQWLHEHGKISIVEFLELARAITESLADIHAQHIIHKDINPANIVFNPDTKQVKMIDFGISTQLSRENPTLKNPNVLEGTLAYISPEQTGRMNRGLDYRTDFYSLGVTFYEMLTGQLPFESNDPLELVHCHIAKVPPTPHTPYATPIVDLVMKLMAKNAEDRYQSADGLKADLEHCRRQFNETGTLVSFPLGQQDICSRFSIPQKLYGRDQEIATLLAAFERVAQTGQVELMMVAGYSGVGKSSLVQELYKPITARRGYFISGKFDQFQRNIPYSAILSAFGGLISQLLAERETELNVWRAKLLTGLGSNGQVMIDVMPELELIIGKQPAVPLLDANEAQNRFNLVLDNFIKTFCSEEHPLTLFIDDLQWADLATLQLIERMLVEEQTEYLLILGAYRDNEVSAGHPLAMSLAKLQQSHYPINKITLKPLPLNQITALIGDTLQQTPQAPKLARLVLQKTGGNPFFVNEFLQALYSEELLQFDRTSRKWQWDLSTIESIGFTDNVVDLMVEKLQKLPTDSQKILSLAACLGAEFELEFLTAIVEKSPQETFDRLKICLDRGFIFPQSELDENLLVQSYKFGHDRIQQAAYELIRENEKPNTHYRIGQLLLQTLSPEARVENIFALVGQLNYATALITQQAERDRLAQLNLIACGKAKDSTAYQTAREYCRIGLSVLGPNSWKRQYNMSLEFHELAVQLASLCGDFESMESFFDTAIHQANSVLDLVNIYRTIVISNISQNKLSGGIQIARTFLHQLGVSFPESPTETHIESNFVEIKDLIKNRQVEDLVDLPRMSDRKTIAIMKITNSIIAATHISSPLLLPLVVCLSVKLSIQYGNTWASPFAYAYYGIIACTLEQDVETGVKFGQLALQLVSKLDSKLNKPEVLCLMGFSILHRKFHTKETLPLQQEAYAIGLDVGKFEFVGYAAHNFCLNSFWCGQPLTSLEQEARVYCHALIQLNQSIAANYCRIHWQSILNLLADGQDPVILSGEALEEVEFLSELICVHDLLGLFFFHIYKLMLCYVFGNIEAAQNQAVEVRRYFRSGAGTVGEPAFYFYDSLTALAALSPEAQNRSDVLQRVEENQQKLQDYWARHAPMNHQHKVDLVSAEKCRVLGQKAEAIELYNQAISGAKQHDYIQEEAIANELIAKFYLNWGQENVARLYMTEAHYCYTRWGAVAKVKHLEQNYPQLCQSPLTTLTPQNFTGHTIGNYTDSTAILDLSTTIKSTNAISSEIVLEKLLATLMDIIVENAGAARGILILSNGEDLFVEASKEPDVQQVSLLEPIPLDRFERLSEKIIHYVARTRETVVLNDAMNQGNFRDDKYIQEYQCQSIACTPLINRGNLQGIIYLENNLTTGAFTQERMALLRTLAGQAAISLENARLYDACQRFVPNQFLSFLEKKSIVDVKLGDQVEREMTVLFSDIRDFTSMSEQMNPAENFAFINEYLGFMEPQIQKHGGFIDKYIGDAIMALFPNSADEAVLGAIAMLEELKKYNSSRQENNRKPLRIGIGLHTGLLMLGTVGGFGRMDGTAIGDAVNLSSRVEGLTKTYGVSLLITHQTLARLNNSLEYDLRFIEQVKAKGKAKSVGLFEVFSADDPPLRDAKNAMKEKFERAVMMYHWGSFPEAARLFQECLDYYQGDRAARSYLDRCHPHIS